MNAFISFFIDLARQDGLAHAPLIAISLPFFIPHASPPAGLRTPHYTRFFTRVTTAPDAKKLQSNERVKEVHSIEEFDQALRLAKDRLVVVEFASRDSDESSKMYPFMVELSRSCSEMWTSFWKWATNQEKKKKRELGSREKMEKVPHFSFYKSIEKD
ncbi:hypothetical protein K1719_026538 [Acacia pycnantha]|nr:hypothetical protein K1719_026538 [Acacia pycnantha]